LDDGNDEAINHLKAADVSHNTVGIELSLVVGPLVV